MMRLCLCSLLSGFLVLGATLGVATAEDHLIAVLLTKDQPRYQAVHAEFEQHLSLNTNQKYRIYVQTPNADIMSLRNSARKAVAIGADMVIAYGTAAALAAQSESDNTPILFADVYDPVKQGLVAADGSARRHTTGVRGDGPIQTLIKVLQQATHTSKLAVLYNPRDPAGMSQVEAAVAMGDKRDFQVIKLPLASATELSFVMKTLPAGTGSLLVTDSTILANRLDEIIALANEQKVPSAAQIPGFADRGGLVALENDPVEQGELLAGLAVKILAGIEPEAIPLEKPHNISLTINLKAATQLGIRVPFEVLAMTTRVIR